MQRALSALIPAVLLALGPAPPAFAETPEQWITLAGRIHGGFGAFLPVGIRLGIDALQRLDAKPREVTVTYYDSDKAPCACIADGIMVATTASPGQRTLTIAAEKAGTGQMAEVVVRHKKTGAAVRYRIAESWLPRIIEWNRTLDERGRFDAAMTADGLFETTTEK